MSGANKMSGWEKQMAHEKQVLLLLKEIAKELRLIRMKLDYPKQHKKNECNDCMCDNQATIHLCSSCQSKIMANERHEQRKDYEKKLQKCYDEKIPLEKSTFFRRLLVAK